MSLQASIEWTEATWNPVTGCTKVSPGCKHCYAERLSRRLQAMKQPNYAKGFELSVHGDLIQLPLKWRKPRLVFVNSMSDLFHEDVPTEFILRVFDTMRRAPQHTFQVLTKRSERLMHLDQSLEWPANVWMGVSVELDRYSYRIDHLRETRAVLRFLSLEPLLGPLPGLDLRGIQWVIVGGESGPGARPMAEQWVLDIRDRCVATCTAFFFKQWGGTVRTKAGRTLQGRTWDEMPATGQHAALAGTLQR